MILSNLRPSFLMALICVVFFEACGSSPVNENRIAALGDTKSEFPFSTREPEVYQADFVTSNGSDETKYFMARKGDKWRVDFYMDSDLSWTTLRSDDVYQIDHKRKICIVPGVDETRQSFDELAINFFTGREYREFEYFGRDGNLLKYSVRRNEKSKDEILVYIDEPSGVMVRQEFLAQKGQMEQGSLKVFIYELRNLRLEVDDSVFQIPDGYQKVTRDESRDQPRKTK